MTRPLFTVSMLFLSAVFVLVGLYSFQEDTIRTRPAVPPFDLFWCKEDAQCLRVDKIGCCSCSEGGAQAAVTRWHKDDLRLFLKKACRPAQVCVQVDTCRYDNDVRCIDNRCRLVPRGSGS